MGTGTISSPHRNSKPRSKTSSTPAPRGAFPLSSRGRSRTFGPARRPTEVMLRPPGRRLPGGNPQAAVTRPARTLATSFRTLATEALRYDRVAELSTGKPGPQIGARNGLVPGFSQSHRDSARRRCRCGLEVRGQARAGGVAVDGGFIGVYSLLRVLVPGVRVLPVVELLRELRQLQRMERVAHHRELVGLVHADRLLRKPRLRTMGEARRVQRDRADVHSASRAELAGDVIDHLLRLEVRMVVRDRHRERVEVELARTERADHEVAALERLV